VEEVMEVIKVIVGSGNNPPVSPSHELLTVVSLIIHIVVVDIDQVVAVELVEQAEMLM